MSIRMILAVAATLAMTVGMADEDEAKEAETEGEQAVEKPQQPKAKLFTALPLCATAEGAAEVMKNGSADWEAAEEGKFYPLGSAFRTLKGGKLTVAFGVESKVSIADGSAFATRVEPMGEMKRTLVLKSGVVELDLARNTPEGAFCVAAPGFVVKNMAGESRITYEDKGDGDLVDIRCVTGAMAIDGRHFNIPVMHAADEVEIRSTRDQLVTILSGRSGDFISRIDRGVVTSGEVDDEGKMHEKSAAAMLDWHLSVGTKVRINRMRPSVGERMSVAVMAFDAAGELKHNFAFCEGRAEVNTGDLVVSKEDSEAVAKKAAEATTTEAAAETEEKPKDEEQADEKESKKDEEKSEEEQ